MLCKKSLLDADNGWVIGRKEMKIRPVRTEIFQCRRAIMKQSVGDKDRNGCWRCSGRKTGGVR